MASHPQHRGNPARTSRTSRTSRDRDRRSLSQNFLTARPAIDRFLDAARPDPDGLLLEVGAGRGALTEVLAPNCRELHAYEIDRHLLPALREGIGRHPRVRLIGADFLTAHPPREAFAVVGNLPFSRTSAIVDWCLRAPLLSSATFVTQLEYARKRSGDYGRWTLRTVQSWPTVNWQLLGRISRNDFRPVPRVDAGILRIDRRTQPLLRPSEMPAYLRLTARGFTGIGGTVRGSLRGTHPLRRVDAALAEARLPRDVIVADVHPEEWLTFYHHLHH